MNKINEVTAALELANKNLETALADGSDTTDARYLVVSLQQELEAFQRIAADEQARIEAEARAEADKQAAELASQVHKEIEAAATPGGLEELNGEPLPALDRNPEIDHASRMIAHAQAKLAAAQERYREQFVKVEKLETRKAEKLAAIDTIKQRRLAGDEQPNDAAELAMLSADAESISGLVTAARNEVVDDRQIYREELAQANKYLAQIKQKETLAACKLRAELAEEILLIAVMAAKIAAKTVFSSGTVIHPSNAYRPSAELRKMVVGTSDLNFF